jgi:hypothetical protein
MNSMQRNLTSEQAKNQLVDSYKIHPDLSSPLKNRRAIASAFENGIRDPAVCFVHGTSLAVLDHALKTGFLPGGLKKQSDGSSAFYILNLPSTYSYVPRGGCTLPKTDSAAIEEVKRYAEAISSHFDSIRALDDKLAHTTGRQPRSFDARLALLAENPLKLRHLYESEGLCPKHALRIDSSFTGSTTHNKILLGFGNSLASEYKLHEAADQDEGLWVKVDRGIPLKYLVSIESLSDHAFEFGCKIQESVESAQADPLEGLTLPKL